MFFINGSDIGSLCGLNPYQSQREIITNFIRKNNPNIFEIIHRFSPEECIHWKERAKVVESKVKTTISEAVLSNESLELIKSEIKQTSKNIDKDLAAITSEVFTRRGTMDEKKSIDNYEKQSNTIVSNRNSKLLKLTIQLEKDMTIEIRGKIDGIEDDFVLEHKRRQRRLFGKVPKYENAQCHVYMKMTGLEKAKLLETFGTTSQIHIINFNESTWNDILERLKLFIKHYNMISNLLNQAQSFEDVESALNMSIFDEKNMNKSSHTDSFPFCLR